MKKAKILSSFVLTCILTILLASTILAADGVKNFAGSVDFWESTVATRTKENTKKVTGINFSDSPGSSLIYVYFSEKKSDGAIVAAKTKFKEGNVKELKTTGVKGNSIRLRAAREYVLDTKVQITGSWIP